MLKQHKRERDGRVKDRIKAVLLRDQDWSLREIAEALFLTEEGVRQHLLDYASSGKLKPEDGGSSGFLNEVQRAELRLHLDAHLYVKASEIAAHVQKTCGVRYSVRGITDWIKSHGFTFHQPCGKPAKADAGAVELTKDPDAMISALKKIAGKGEIEGVPTGITEMCLDNPRHGFADLFATHPAIKSRILALMNAAGGPASQQIIH